MLALFLAVATGIYCGEERINVKHLSDPDAGKVKLTPVQTTITELAKLPVPNPPVGSDDPRGLALVSHPEISVASYAKLEEFQTFTVDGWVSCAKVELGNKKTPGDHDIHICLSEKPPGVRTVKGKRVATITKPSIISESVDGRCTDGSTVADKIRGAREQILTIIHSTNATTKSVQKLLGKHVRVTGVGFYDKLHGQTGVAPNGIELHPILDFALIP